MKTILALDPASKKTGYCVMESPSKKLISYGLIASSSRSVEKRLALLFTEVTNLISKHKVDVLAMETPLGKTMYSRKTNDVLNQVRGVMMVAGFLAKLQMVYIQPIQAKKAVCHDIRHPSKENVLEAVNLLYKGNNFVDLDISDSIAVALASVPYTIV